MTIKKLINDINKLDITEQKEEDLQNLYKEIIDFTYKIYTYLDTLEVDINQVELLYLNMIETCKRFDIIIPPLPVLKKLKIFATLKKNSKDLFKFIKKSKIEYIKQSIFFIMIIEFIINYLRKIKVIVSLKTIIDQLANWRTFIDNEFPGYIENGLISKII